MQVARVMQWQERMATLRGLSMWEAALAMGLAILAAAQSSLEAGGTPHNQAVWRCEGRGAAVDAVAARMTQTLLSFLEWAVREGGAGDNAAELASQVGLRQESPPWHVY